MFSTLNWDGASPDALLASCATVSNPLVTRDIFGPWALCAIDPGTHHQQCYCIHFSVSLLRSLDHKHVTYLLVTTAPVDTEKFHKCYAYFTLSYFPDSRLIETRTSLKCTCDS